MNQATGAAGRHPFPPTPLAPQESLSGQAAMAADTLAPQVFTAELLEPPPAPAKAAASVNLPQPPFWTVSASTIEHLGALGSLELRADMDDFMKVFLKMNQESRNSARTQRDVAMLKESTTHQQVVEQMKKSANERFKGALSSGVLQILSGMAQAGSSAYSAHKTLQAGQLKAEGKGMLQELKAGAAQMGPKRQAALQTGGDELLRQSRIAGGLAGKAQAFSQGAGAIAVTGNMIGAYFTSKADMHDAQRAELEALASVLSTSAQQSNDAMQQHQDAIRDLLEKMQSMDQATVATNSGIARNF